MEFKELLSKIEVINKYINEKNNTLSKSELSLLKVVKLGEEVGELNNEVLKKIGFARKEKLENYDDEELSGEIADVIITALGIAYEHGINVEDSLNKKINKVYDRFNLNK